MTWLPRYKPRKDQCASCPFLQGNDKQFGSVVDALRKKEAEINNKPCPRPATKTVVSRARVSVRLDVLRGSGDFVCHATAYGPNMEVSSSSAWRQCPGATALRSNR